MDNPSEKSNDVEQKVAEWLTTEGYPLEFRVASTFKKFGISIRQGFYVSDFKSNAQREIDVIAETTAYDNKSFLRICYVVECKWSKDKPWVVFTSEDSRMGPAACIAQTIGSDVGDAILWSLAGDKEVQSLDAFSTPDRPGFGGRQVFTKTNDLFYNTLQSVSAATYSLANYYNEPRKKRGYKPDFAVIMFPVIVIDGQLFDAHFDDAKGGMCVQEVSRIRVHWQGSEQGTSHTHIDIVTANHLDDFLEKRKDEMFFLLQKLLTCFKKIQQCFEYKTLEPLVVLPAARGFTGLPPLLLELKKKHKL